MSSGNSKPTHHYGRGGAGNVTAKTDQTPVGPPATTPTLKSKNYTTGRGGQGNIVEYRNAEIARAAQDVDVPGVALPEAGFHTGRGGGGNVYQPSEEEIEANKANNKQLRSGSFKEKVKNIFSSDKDAK